MASINERHLFQQFFERAYHRGLSIGDAANGLLEELKDPRSGFVAWGRCRIFHVSEDPNGSQLVETLPRRLHAEPIPANFWEDFASVTDEGDSYWCDDPDELEEWAKVDWIGGTASDLRWEWGEPPTLPMREYSALEIGWDIAQSLIDRMAAGEPRISRDAIDQARQAFIRTHSGVGGYDEALREWRAHSLYDGTKQPEWRKEWRIVRGSRGPGAPKKAASHNP